MKKCACCGLNMEYGFSVFDGEYNYCSEDCLHTAYSKAEYDLLDEWGYAG